MTLSMVLVAITLNNMFINATFLHMYLYFPLLEWDLQGSHFQHHLHQQHIDFQLGNDILQRKKRTFNTSINMLTRSRRKHNLQVDISFCGGEGT